MDSDNYTVPRREAGRARSCDLLPDCGRGWNRHLVHATADASRTRRKAATGAEIPVGNYYQPAVEGRADDWGVAPD